MEPTILDENLIETDTLDVYESFIWTDRYCGFGDFEITGPPNNQFMGMVENKSYLELPESEHLMVIETLHIHSDTEQGNRLIIKGRSLETILERRIIVNQTVLSGDTPGSFQNAIHRILNENAISPSDPNRTISRLVFEESDDPIVLAQTIDNQYTGDIVYNVVNDLCAARGLGFKITLSDEGLFVFKLYSGVDRSYNQLSNPYVVFSPNNDNLQNSDYISTNQYLKTVSYSAGELGVGNARRTEMVEAPGGAGTDLDRREMYTDASNVTKSGTDGDLTDDQYVAQLQQRGIDDLVKNTMTQSFEGQIDASVTYTYNEDYGMGDIVEVANEYGQEATSRVTELILSQDPAGPRKYPTFSAL